MRPTKETYKRDLQKRPALETYKRDQRGGAPEREGAEEADGTSGCRLSTRVLERDLQKRSTLRLERDLQKRPTLQRDTQK